MTNMYIKGKLIVISVEKTNISQVLRIFVSGNDKTAIKLSCLETNFNK